MIRNEVKIKEEPLEASHFDETTHTNNASNSIEHNSEMDTKSIKTEDIKSKWQIVKQRVENVEARGWI